MILGTVRGKMIAYSAMVLLIIAAASLYTGLASSELARSVELLFRDSRVIEDVGDALTQTESSLSSYLGAKSSDALRDYIRYSTSLAGAARRLNREIRTDDYYLLQRDLAGLVDRYLEDADASVAAKRGRDVTAYSERFTGAEETALLARQVIGLLEGIVISDSLDAFSGFNSRIPGVLASNAGLVIAATLFGLMIMVRYSYKLTDPLSRLAEAARAVGRGEYDHAPPPVDSGDEIGMTTAAFSSMMESVRRSFDELREKAEVEKNLMEERVRLLDMDHKLKDAELLALQTQINPHFLFNTLSAGQQLALSEGADRTADFMENLAAFIRYALKPPSRSVRVSDEIECAELYVWLLRLRFGERYAFEIAVDERALDVETPALILQPLIENAVGHGLKDRESGGLVRLSVTLEGEAAVLSVEDNGEGMDEGEAERLGQEYLGDAELLEGGIGLRNVMRRVALATGGEGRVELDTRLGGGTTVRIRLPARGGVS